MATAAPKIVLDVSLTLNLRGQIVSGIPRVEENFAEALMRRTDIDAAFCRYRSRHNAFQYVPAHVVREVLQQPRVKPSPYWPPHKQTMFRRFGKAIERGWRRHLFPPSNLVDWSPRRIYISVGAWWNLTYDEPLRFMFDRSRCRKVLMCHDAIPALFPDYFEDRDAESRFRDGLKLLSTADLALCNSQITRRDLLSALADSGTPCPPTKVVPLPPGISPESTKPAFPPGMPDGDFVLAVGSISQRKNQIMLCDVWSRFGDEPALAGVKLVMAGSWGDHSAAVRERLQRDSKLAQRVIVRNDITDGELAWLYRNCRFSVYPSFYEGWGLPISESLSFGKLCIASDTSAMPEAGQGLCVHHSPGDPESWYRTIRDLLLNPSRLEMYEKEIASRYCAASWDEIIDQILNSVR